MSATIVHHCGAVIIVRDSVLVPGVYARACPQCGETVTAQVI